MGPRVRSPERPGTSLLVAVIVVAVGAGCGPDRGLGEAGQNPFPGASFGDRAAELFVRAVDGALVSDGGPSRGVAWGDVDGDGLPDLAVANDGAWPPWLYRNRGGGAFEQEVDGWPLSGAGFSQGVAWIDYDDDGDLDLHLTDWGTRGHPLHDGPTYRPTSLFRNDGGGAEILPDLVPVAAGDLTTNSVPAVQACWADYDADGDLDVFLAVRDDVDDALYENRGDGTFRRVRRGPWVGRGGLARTCGAGDADGDGLPEIYVGNFAGEDNVLYRNRGDLRFDEDVDSHLSQGGGRTYGVSWVDYDDDGDLDLYVANGTMGTEDVPDFGLENFLYLSRGDGTFRRVTTGPAVTDRRVSAGVATADYDRDGDLDLFVANWGGGAEERSNDLYRNTTSDRTSRRWVLLRLEGVESNRYGIGAEVRVLARIGRRPVWLTRRLSAGTGFASQDEPTVHVGLGDAPRVDSLVVRWPSGAVARLADLEVDRVYHLREDGALRLATGS